MKSIVDKPFGLLSLFAGLRGIELFVFNLLVDGGLLPILLAEDGGVYLWLRDLDDQTAGPRACRLPYNKDLHRKVDDTLRKLQAGEWLVGTRLPGGDARRIRIEFEAVKRDTGAHKSSQN